MTTERPAGLLRDELMRQVNDTFCRYDASVVTELVERYDAALPGPDGLDVDTERVRREVMAVVKRWDMGPEQAAAVIAAVNRGLALPATPDAGKGEVKVAASSRLSGVGGSDDENAADQASQAPVGMPVRQDGARDRGEADASDAMPGVSGMAVPMAGEPGGLTTGYDKADHANREPLDGRSETDWP